MRKRMFGRRAGSAAETRDGPITVASRAARSMRDFIGTPVQILVPTLRVGTPPVTLCVTSLVTRLLLAHDGVPGMGRVADVLVRVEDVTLAKHARVLLGEQFLLQLAPEFGLDR